MRFFTMFVFSILTIHEAKAVCTANISPGGATTFCSGGSVNLTASMSGSGLTYQWRLNGNPISGATNQVYNVTSSGSYSVTVTNNTPCTATSSAITVTVNTTPTATISPLSSTSFCSANQR